MNKQTEPAMDVPAKPQDLLAFHMTGKRHGGGLHAIESLDLRPALLAPYRDLSRLRYDFPVVLVEQPTPDDYVRSLSSVVNEVLRNVAPRGIEGERLRKHGLELEREIRVLLGEGANWTLSELWAMAAARLGNREGEALEQVLVHAAGTLNFDGELADCTAGTPAAFITHAWQAAQNEKAARFRAELSRLTLKLSDILRAAFVHSKAGAQPEALAASLGAPHRDTFDFAVMSRLVGKVSARNELPASRRQRIERALEVLKSQRFYGTPAGAPQVDTPAPHEFMFDNLAAAAAAFRERVPEMVELAKAMSIAELEAEGRYVEAKHDAVFANFDADTMGPDGMAMFPDYLVCIDPRHADAPENAKLLEALSGDLPVKVLVQVTDVLEESAIGTGHFAFGVRSVQLASAAIGLNEVFVLQSASSNLHPLRDRIAGGMRYRGPALFSVFSTADTPASALPPYLATAAAMQSRAFPAFTYDPAAGADLASRFSLEDNPQPEADWPVEPFEYSDEAMQRVAENLSFTLADFVSCDRRYARHFARVPRAQWSADMVPAAEWLASPAEAVGNKVPYVVAVDGEDVLHRLIVDAKLMQAARRCREMWHRLQELGGVHNSHAARLLAREKAAWEEEKQRELAALKSTASTAAPAAASATAAPAAAEPATKVEEAAPEHSKDETWIETERCPSCGECRNINDKMFGYNENKQAFIADLKAGTYRQLIEAAEACQVAIIHPGKPWNPAEPGLEDLIERAQPFL
jgi:ferredoxin